MVDKKRTIDDVDIIALAEQFSEEEQLELMDRFDACQHGRKLRCDDCSNRDWDAGRKEGFNLGFQWVIVEVSKRAAEAFIADKDSDAKMLRAIVKEVIEHAKKEKVWVKP